MTRTSLLDILVDISFPYNKLVIHPNTAFDIKFMQSVHLIKLFTNLSLADFQADNGKAMQSQLCIENKCRQNTIEISKKLWNDIGKPKKALLIHEDNRVLLLGKN